MPVATGAGKRESYSGDYKAAGRTGEAVVLDWLRARPSVREVQDLTADWHWRQQDVDARIVWQDGREELAEIKSDAHAGPGRNMLFELMRLHHRTDALGRAAEVGWSLRSPADWLFIYAPTCSSILYCRMAPYRSWFQACSQKNLNNMRIGRIATDNHKSTLAVLVPWQECGHLFHVVNIPKIGSEPIAN